MTYKSSSPSATHGEAKLLDALKSIAQLESQPIGNTGFAVGPLALLKAAQRIAKDAMKGTYRGSKPLKKALVQAARHRLRESEDIPTACRCEGCEFAREIVRIADGQ